MEKINIKIVVKVLTPIILITLSIFFLSYGNVKNHRDINSFIVESFVSKNNKFGASMSDFKQYTFRLNLGKLEGYYVSKPGYFNHSLLDDAVEDDKWAIKYVKENFNSISEEELGKKTPKEWIRHGGFSADVPEIPASLRHFYDPTRAKGDRYLLNNLNSTLMNYLKNKLKNSETDGVEWALGTKGSVSDTRHIYTWKYGKFSIKRALEEADVDKRKKYMAKAWRSLGETLHMIADNGCPAHVRNDGHPAFPYIESFGNPDFYEEYMAKRPLNNFSKGPVSKKLKTKFMKDKTVDSIAHHMAVFTNKNFFTSETISGTDWKGNKVIQITHPEYEYKSPKLSSQSYDKNYYHRKIEGLNNDVLIATDAWFFQKKVKSKSFPHLNEECAVSQAKVLIPAIIEAGVNVIKLFIPKLKISISEVSEGGTISGEIIHLNNKDLEYKEKILYNGPVLIKKNGISKIGTFNARNGKFSGEIKVEKETRAIAEIEFGGIIVHSKEFIIKSKKKEKKIEEIDPVINGLTNNGRWVRYAKKEVNGCARYESECWPLESCTGGDGSYQITIGASTCGSGASGYSGSGTYTVPPSTLIPGESYVFKATAEGKGYTSINIYFYKTLENLTIDETGKTSFSSEWNQRIVKNSNSPGTYIVPIDLNKKGVIIIEAGGSIGNAVTSRYNNYLYKWKE